MKLDNRGGLHRKTLTSLVLRGSHTSETSLMQLQEFSDVNAS
jgi:hypothetical protein